MEYARMQDVIETPRLHPALRPMYTFEIERNPPSTIPMISARIVSCGVSSPA